MISAMTGSHRRASGIRHRRGAAALEAAIVYPVMIMFIIGIIVGGLGVHRYQMVACQAQEAARWASVRGADWAKETNTAVPTKADIEHLVVLPLAVGMDAAKLKVEVHWINQVTGEVVDWDSSSKAPTTKASNGDYVHNAVRVTIIYQWTPQVSFIPPVNLKSVSERPMSY